MDRNKLFNIIIFLIIAHCGFGISAYSQIDHQAYAWRISGAELLSKLKVDTTDQVRIKQIADSSNHTLNDFACLFLAQHGVKDILPDLNGYFIQAISNTNWERSYYLLASLLYLDDQRGFQNANAFLDSMIIQKNEFRATYNADEFAQVIDILVDYGDFSRYDFFKNLFTGYDRATKFDIQIFYHFSKDPSKEQDAYDRVKGLTNDSNDEIRYYALKTLNMFKNNSSKLSVLKNASLNDKSFVNRDLATSLLLYSGNIAEAIQGYNEIVKSSNDSINAEYVINILASINSPLALAALVNLRNELPQGYLHDEINLTLKVCISGPSVNSTLLNIIDTISVFIQQVASLGWIGDQSYITQLQNFIINAKTPLLTKTDSIKSARYITIFQQAVDREFRDSSNVTPAFITTEGWKFLYYNAQYILDRLPQILSDPAMISISPTNVYAGSSAFTFIVSGHNFTSSSTLNWNGVAKTTIFVADSILQASILASDIVVIDSPLVSVKNPDGGESNGIRFYIKKQPVITGCNVKLINSTGTIITGGSLQYYDSAWKDALNNNDGTFSVVTNLKTINLRMTYEYGSQTKSNVSRSTDTIVFQTVNSQVQLQNSLGAFIDTGTVQYYAGAWRNLGTTSNGVATKELLPNNYSFRMTYGYASNDKQQDISINPTVIFKTINAVVQLKNRQGTLMPAPSGDQGTVQYYSGAWRDLGTTINGVASKDLLPNTYSFRMNYAYASKDKQQDISANATVVFQTVNAAVQLQNSQGTLMPAPSGDQGTVQYYSGAWRDLGTTVNGVVSKDLLPNTYSFRMNYASASKDKQQDITTNPTVVFQTVNVTVQLKNSLGTLIDTGVVQYYSGTWLTLGTTTNGVASKDLLPNTYSFRMSYAYASKDKQQDISANATVVFQTVNAAVQLQNSNGVLMDTGTVQYYSGAWRILGTTINGIANKELLPNSYSFRMTYALVSLDKTQDISGNSTVSFSTVLCTIRVKNSQNQLVDNALASYYPGVWKQIGNTVNGVITKELLPVSLSFRVKYGTQQIDKKQNLSMNNIVDFVIP